MSGAARRRRRGRGRGRSAHGDRSSDSSSRRGDRVPAGGFDGPASRGSASGTGTSQGRRPSNAGSATSGQGSQTPPEGGVAAQGSQPGSRRASLSGSQPSQSDVQTAPQPPPGDPARDRPARYTDGMKNIDLAASYYNVDQLFSMPTEFKRRPGFNNSGKAIQLQLNAYAVTQFPNVNIFQYDVIIGNGAEKRIVQRKVWESKARKSMTPQGMLYDGNKLAWALTDIGDKRVMVDLDAEEGRPSRGDGNTFRLHIRRTKKLDISIVNRFLDGKVQMGVPVLETINFLDHLLREGPSTNSRFFTLKRSLFTREGQRYDLGGGIEVYRGVYQSMRLAEGKKLIVNLDVANSCFWKPGHLITAIMANSGLRDVQQLVSKLAQPQGQNPNERSAFSKTVSGRIKGTTVKVIYSGNQAADKEWKIFRIDAKNANQEMIEWNDPKTKQPTGQQVSIAEYFKRKYNIRLQNPTLHLVEMTKKKTKYPMEFLQIVPNQRYSTKLDDTQTANMIKFAVSPPASRLAAIDEGKKWLDWPNDKFLNNYGLRIDNNTIKTQARLLPPPGVKFGGNRIEQPGTKGRWDLRGKKFLTTNPAELQSWGIGYFTKKGNVNHAAIVKFATDFSRAYRDHGGRVANGLPHIMALPEDAGLAVETLHTATGNKFQLRPQLMIFLVQDKQAFHYLRIKKSCDCRYGIVSQVMQLNQVLRGSPQYYSNVLMKVNAKLGGCTSQVVPHASSGFKGTFGGPTMFIGADVSHPSPGSLQPSMAAISVSFDKHAGRYVAACQTNGHRAEMISEANIRSMLGPLAQQWASEFGTGRGPRQVFYMRDGVSEGQFSHVMQQEVPHIREVMTQIDGQPWTGKITVVIASKRHHTRAFPKQGDVAGDQRGNPVPGCLIERDATTPTEFDFFLFSHIALQGTSRPVHYTILHDDANFAPNVIQNMIYEHCYQYMRSTTSVSLHPAVYYAHLASNRAKAHEDIAASQGPQGGPGFKVNRQGPSSDPPDSEAKPLIPIFDKHGLKFAMWYI